MPCYLIKTRRTDIIDTAGLYIPASVAARLHFGWPSSKSSRAQTIHDRAAQKKGLVNRQILYSLTPSNSGTPSRAVCREQWTPFVSKIMWEAGGRLIASWFMTEKVGRYPSSTQKGSHAYIFNATQCKGTCSYVANVWGKVVEQHTYSSVLYWISTN